MKRKDNKVSLFILLTACYCLFSFPVFASIKGQSKILKIAIVHSYHKGFSWTEDVESGFLQKISSEFPVEVINRFYLDAKNEPQKVFEKSQLAISNLKNTKFDLLFLTDDNAMKSVGVKFIKSHHFVVFAGINELLSEYGIGEQGKPDLESSLPKLWAGVLEYYPVAPLLSLIHKLHPNVKVMNLFYDESVTSKAVRLRFEQELKSKDSKKFKFKIGKTIVSNNSSKWESELANINPKSEVNLIFPFSNVKRTNGANFSSSLDRANWLISKSTAPEYATASLTMNFPFFATVGIRGSEHGSDAGENAINLIRNLTGPKLTIGKYARLNLNIARAKELKIYIPFEFQAYSYSLKTSTREDASEKSRN